jgi:hypothetical protein
MEPINIAQFGAEGGGCTVYGSQHDDVWSFWYAGSSMHLDEHDEDVWLPWSSEPVPNLLDALPQSWWRMLLLFVHPDFEAQLHDAFMTHRHKPGWRAERFHRYLNLFT